MRLRTLFSPLLDALFPPACALCDTLYRPTPIAPVCAACQAATQWLDGPILTAHFPDPAWDGVHALCRFDGPVVDAIHRLKYLARRDIGPALGRLLVERVFAGGPHDLVLPVPLHRDRLRARGYNQAQLVARPLARACRRMLLPAALRRIRATAPQVGLDPAARRANVRGAFVVAPRDAARVAGKRCLLIDDVMTTGATLHGCAVALRRAGAARVHACVIAVA